MEILPSAPDAERDMVGSVIFDEIAFERAGLKSSDFHILRWRWFWGACEAIRRADDHIDELSLEKELIRAEHLEDVTSRGPLINLLNTNMLHVEANARTVREMAERRRMLAGATELARRACDLTIPLPPAPEPVKTHWTLEELASAEFPEPDGPIPGIIPNGLTVLGGRPKRGKSWLMLQAGCSLAQGGKFLGRDLQSGKVLYYALEDHQRRLKERTAKLGIASSNDSIEFERALKPLHLGGLAQVEQAAKDGNFQMIIIDTLWRAMPGKDHTKEGALFDDILGQLQQMAQQANIAIVVILHTRKNNAGADPDPVDDVLGSTGLTASADCVLGLYTGQDHKGATLKGRARDLDDIDEAMQWDPLTWTWQSLGESDAVRITESKNEILDVLGELGKAQIHTIARTLGKDYSNMHKRISALWTSGKMKKEVIEGKIFYFLPMKKEDKEVPTHPTHYP